MDDVAPALGAHGQWLVPADAVDEETARAALVRRWLAAFGPATVTDVKWWFGHTLTWARQALRDIGAVEVDLDGAPGFALPDDFDVEPEPEPWCAVARPGRHHDGLVRPGLVSGATPQPGVRQERQRGPTAWCDGRIVGAWGQDDDDRVEVRLLEDVGRCAHKALQRRADELTEWLDGVRISPRFPSPLSKR